VVLVSRLAEARIGAILWVRQQLLRSNFLRCDGHFPDTCGGRSPTVCVRLSSIDAARNEHGLQGSSRNSTILERIVMAAALTGKDFQCWAAESDVAVIHGCRDPV
jgi:hypothetical protein